MTTYNSYEAAKIANPESEIVTTGENWQFEPVLKGKFERLVEGGIEPHVLGDCAWVKCNPANHCMTVEQFLKAGHKFSDGDLYMNLGGLVHELNDEKINSLMSRNTSNRYILRAAALEEKPKRVKVEYVKCEYGDKVSNIVMDFENNAPLYKMVNDEYWTIDELDDLFAIILDGGEHIYRRIETEITERDEFINECIVHGGLRARDGAREVYGNLFDSGKFKLVE